MSLHILFCAARLSQYEFDLVLKTHDRHVHVGVVSDCLTQTNIIAKKQLVVLYHSSGK